MVQLARLQLDVFVVLEMCSGFSRRTGTARQPHTEHLIFNEVPLAAGRCSSRDLFLRKVIISWIAKNLRLWQKRLSVTVKSFPGVRLHFGGWMAARDEISPQGWHPFSARSCTEQLACQGRAAPAPWESKMVRKVWETSLGYVCELRGI